MDMRVYLETELCGERGEESEGCERFGLRGVVVHDGTLSEGH